MEASLTVFMRCTLLVSLLCGAVSVSHSEPLKRAVVSGNPFSLAIPADYEQQQSDGLEVAFANSKNLCSISMLMGKSKIERDLWKKIYQSRDNLNAYNNKFTDRLSMVPANIVKDSEIKTEKGEPLKVYFSTQVMGEESTDIWESLYTASDNFSINFIQCPKGVMSDADAHAILKTIHPETVSSLKEDLGQLPFSFRLKPPYYAASIQYPSWQSVRVNLNQNVDQTSQWVDTQALLTYEKGPYLNMEEAINKSATTQDLKLGTTKIVMQNNDNINGHDGRFYLIAARDMTSKTGILLYLMRSKSGELLALKATTTSDKVQNFYEPISNIAHSLRFESEMAASDNWRYADEEPVPSKTTAPEASNEVSPKATKAAEDTASNKQSDRAEQNKKAAWQHRAAP